jgi:hypothetical protein
MRGAFALGAALGWGPARIWDFIARGGAEEALANCQSKRVQNLVVFVGSSGAHGYPHLLWPQADMFYENRTDMRVEAANQNDPRPTVHFLMGPGAGGRVTRFQGLLNVDQSDPTREAPSTILGQPKWAVGERFRKIFSPDVNMGFGGFQSRDPTSQSLDQAVWGSTRVPTNAAMDPKKKFFVAARETPWLKWGPKKWVTQIDGGGVNPFHVTGAHNHYINGDNMGVLAARKKWSVMAAAAAIQLARPSIVPIIFVGDMASNEGSQLGFYGRGVTGAPTPAFVADANGLVNLFNANVAKAVGVMTDQSSKNALIFEAYTKGLIGSSKTATLPTYSKGYKTVKLAANLVGLNLSERLAPNAADRERYGFTGSNPSKYAQFRDNCIVAAKALANGLTSQVVIGYFNDDPHGLFRSEGQSGTGDNAATAARFFGNILEAFMDDLMSVPDPVCPNVRLGDNTVIAFVGDTPRTAVSQFNWNDPTVGLQNRVWVMSNGLLKPGNFGGDRPRRFREGATSNDHNAAGPGDGCMWDLQTGDAIPFDGAGRVGNINGNLVLRQERGETAMAAILYAVAGGEIRKVNEYYSGQPFPAVQIPVLI